MPALPSIPKITSGKSEITVTPWDEKRGLYRACDTSFIVKEFDDTVAVVGITCDNHTLRILTPTEADQARKLGLIIRQLDDR